MRFTPLVDALLRNTTPYRCGRHVDQALPQQPQCDVATGVQGRWFAQEVLTFVKGTSEVKENRPRRASVKPLITLAFSCSALRPFAKQRLFRRVAPARAFLPEKARAFEDQQARQARAQRLTTMSDLTVTTDKPISPKYGHREKDTGKRLRIGKKLEVALKAIVWEGQELDQAAATAGLTTQTVRLALARAHVVAFLKNEREVFRAHVSAQNIHRAKQIRDESGNAMAQLGAMKFIEQISDDPKANAQRVQQPGIVIVVGAQPAQPPVTITPMRGQHVDEAET